MNQAFKNEIYQLCTNAQAEFICNHAGLTEKEMEIFWAWREGEEDINIAADYLDGNEKKLKAIERKIRTKISIAVFDCIAFRMMYLEKIS